MRNQRQLWNEEHEQGGVDHYSSEPTDFAREVLAIVKPTSKILELGCGVGNDAVAFAKAGHIITATDFSEVAVMKNRERFSAVKNLTFTVLDIARPMGFEDNSFEVV